MQLRLPISPFLLLMLAAVLPGCDNSDVLNPQATTYPFARHWCVNDRECANFEVYMPQVTGYDSVLTRRIEMRVERDIADFVGAPQLEKVEIAIDSAATLFIDRFVQYKRENPDSSGLWMKHVTTTFPLVRPELLSIAMTFTESEAGKPERNFTRLSTLDLTGGTRVLGLSDLTNRPDELLALIEQGVKAACGLPRTADVARALKPDQPKLPLPANIAVVPDGLRIVYNRGEATLEKFAATDMLLTWAQLGELVDRERWGL